MLYAQRKGQAEKVKDIREHIERSERARTLGNENTAFVLQDSAQIHRAYVHVTSNGFVSLASAANLKLRTRTSNERELPKGTPI